MGALYEWNPPVSLCGLLRPEILDRFPQNKLPILSDNSHYEPINADPDQVEISGKVIWFGREMER